MVATVARVCQVGVQAPRETERLETLNVFGIRADYVRRFRAYPAGEGPFEKRAASSG